MPVPSPTVSVDVAARRHARTILGRLKTRYPAIRTKLEYLNPWQLLVSTVLSAQTTDVNVNKVAPVLFDRWPEPADLGAADPDEVEAVIFSTGFFHQKTKSIIALSQDLLERFGGEVPSDLDDLVTLQGVGRKTASVVLAEVWDLPAIAVDTHVNRVANRLSLTDVKDPVKVEADLCSLYPEREWSGISMRFIQFGRDVCNAKRPNCWQCEMTDRCRYPEKTPPPE